MTETANGDIRDIERELLKETIDEKQPQQTLEKHSSKMPSLRRCLFIVLAICLLAVVCSASNARIPRSPTRRDRAKFQDLLNSIDPSSLHDVLHEHMGRYKHGVYKEDKAAIAVVHQETPEVASSLVELAKRQAPGGNSSVITTSTTAVTTESTSTIASSITSSTVITEPSSTPTTQETTPVTSAPPVTTTEVSTGTSSSVVVVSSSESIVTSTSQETIESQTSSPSPTSQASITSLNIYTTTLPNGKASTVTQYTVVPAGQPDQTAAGASSKTAPNAVLQTNGGSTKEIGTSVVLSMILMMVLGAL